MSSLYPFGFILPTDAPCPPADILAGVEDQIADPWGYPYCNTDEYTMSRFQWLGMGFEAELSGKVQIKANGYPDEWAWADQTLTFSMTEIAINSGAFPSVEGRMPSGPFAAGTWVSFVTLGASDEQAFSGSHDAYGSLGHVGQYTVTNYRIRYQVEIGAFRDTADPIFSFPDPIIPGPHLYQTGTDYKIPFRVGLRFEADIVKNDPEFADPPSFAMGCGTSTLGSGDRTVGAAEVVNGEVVLFEGLYDPDTGETLGGFGLVLPGTNEETTVYNAIYFEDVHFRIKALTLATLP